MWLTFCEWIKNISTRKFVHLVYVLITTVHVHMRFDIPQAELCVCVCVCVCVCITVHAVYVIMSNCTCV